MMTVSVLQEPHLQDVSQVIDHFDPENREALGGDMFDPFCLGGNSYILYWCWDGAK